MKGSFNGVLHQGIAVFVGLDWQATKDTFLTWWVVEMRLRETLIQWHHLERMLYVISSASLDSIHNAEDRTYDFLAKHSCLTQSFSNLLRGWFDPFKNLQSSPSLSVETNWASQHRCDLSPRCKSPLPSWWLAEVRRHKNFSLTLPAPSQWELDGESEEPREGLELDSPVKTDPVMLSGNYLHRDTELFCFRDPARPAPHRSELFLKWFDGWWRTFCPPGWSVCWWTWARELLPPVSALLFDILDKRV